MKVIFAVYDYRTNPDAVLEVLRRELEALLGDTNSGVVRVEATKGAGSEIFDKETKGAMNV
jgi:hypothetical protein